jgi:hypothetical protein
MDDFQSKLKKLHLAHERALRRAEVLRLEIRDHFKHCPHEDTYIKTDSMTGGYLDRSWEREDLVCLTCNKVLEVGKTHYGYYA